MTETQIKPARNQAIECARMVAAFFVVFIHCQLPGKFGNLVVCVGRFAVPMFFMISGYFSYQVSSKRLAGRVKHMLWLNVIATALYALKRYLLESNFSWGLMETVLELMPGKVQLMQWLVLGLNPYSEHLWYLAAICLCYMIFWVYVTALGGEKLRYQPFYGVSFGLLIVQFMLSEMATIAGVPVPYVLCRNALLPGLAMFGTGLFLREHKDQLIKNFALSDRKLILIIVLGVGYSLFQYVSTGPVELPIGTVAAAVALMLLMVNHPRICTKNKFVEKSISKFGFLSAAVYIEHQFFNMLYPTYGMAWATSVFGKAEPVIQPILILCISLVAAIVSEQIWCGWKKLGNRMK